MGLFDDISERVEGFFDEVFMPEDVRRLLDRASRLIDRGDYDQALQLLGRASERQPGLARTHHLTGLCHLYRDDFGQARSSFETAIETREEPASRFYAGLAAEQLGDLHGARAHYNRALSTTEAPPFEFDLHFGLGRVYLREERFDKAERELRKAHRASDDEPELLVALARALFERGEFEESRQLLEAVSPGHVDVEARVLRGRLEEEDGDLEAAARWYEEALEADASNIEALVGAARAHLAGEAPSRAREHLLRAREGVEEATSTTEIDTLLGRAHEDLGDAGHALECYRRAIEDDASEVRAPDARLGASRLLLDRGDPDRAAAHFEVLLRAGPGEWDVEAKTGLARCRRAQGQLAEARHLLEGADDALEPEETDGRSAARARIQYELGRIGLDSGDPADALVALQEALHHADDPELQRAAEEARDEALEALSPTWNLPDALETPLQIEQVLDQLQTWIGGEPELDHLLPDVHALVDRLERPLSIAIVGEFNAGKSTLVNALLGEEVVPMGILPTTAHPCVIKYGPRNVARIHYREDAPDDADDAAEVRADGDVVEVPFEEARRRMEEESDVIARLEFLYPHPRLRSLHFEDTPGFNALDEDHDVIASRAIEEAEAVLWVFDANQTLTRTELEQLEAISNRSERLFVLLNKIDRLGTDETRRDDVDEIETYVADRIGDEVAGCFAVSALEALEARTSRNEEETSGERTGDFEIFESTLERECIRRAGRLKVLEIRDRLADLVDAIERTTDALEARYVESARQLEQLQTWLEDLEDEHPETFARREADTIEDQLDFALTSVAREIDEARRPRGTFFSEMVLDDEDRRFVLNLLEERLEAILERSRRRVSNDVDRIESTIAQKMGPILEALSLAHARSIDRRLEGLFDEIRAMELLLDERVYGQLQARAIGQIEAAGLSTLRDLESDDDESTLKHHLRELIPATREPIREDLQQWYREFLFAVRRFSDRVRRDLHLLQLEAEYRYDTNPLIDLIRET